jgi:murein DD-endopeptidase MepM/ murein hydrolase activator NlpD
MRKEQTQNSRSNISDFGISLRDLTDTKSRRKFIKVNFSQIFKVLSLKNNLFLLFKYTLYKLGQIRSSVVRSSFIGRGFYFKYISNFALIVIIGFGTFVYLGYDKDSLNPFLSRYSGIMASNPGVLYGIGGQAFVAENQYRITQYTVQPGDTLASIAAKYSTDTNKITVDSIMWANNLNENTVLIPGMKLDIPPVSGVLHVVKKGDSVFTIAKKYNLLSDSSSYEEIVGVTQKITDINYLNIKVVQEGDKEVRVPELIEGQKIIVPGGIKVTPTPPVFYAREDTGILGWPVAGWGVISQGWYPWHQAVDVANNYRPKLVAMDDGIIVNFGILKNDNGAGLGCGLAVLMQYKSGYEVLFCHFDAFEPGLYPGMPISKGQVLGQMGCTGVCTGPHVHIRIKKNGRIINPCTLDIFRGKGDCGW